ncbi:MAG: DUF1499 domain-containing protein [Pseudomonadota bacterium]
MIVFILALLGGLMLLIAGPGTRLEVWAFGTGFLLMRYALYAAGAAALLALVLVIIPKTRAGNVGLLVAALVIGLATASIPLNGVRTARSLPFIHDITTDTVNPPAFVDVLPLRADAPNPPEYAGEEIAQQQREGYPDLQTLTLTDTPSVALSKAEQAVQAMGLEMVAVVPDEGRIEATATTFWFGFKDDVVIRVVPDGNGSRLDIRSKSRVGTSDIGANAARIRHFIELVEQQ